MTVNSVNFSGTAGTDFNDKIRQGQKYSQNQAIATVNINKNPEKDEFSTAQKAAMATGAGLVTFWAVAKGHSRDIIKEDTVLLGSITKGANRALTWFKRKADFLPFTTLSTGEAKKEASRLQDVRTKAQEAFDKTIQESKEEFKIKAGDREESKTAEQLQETFTKAKQGVDDLGKTKEQLTKEKEDAQKAVDDIVTEVKSGDSSATAETVKSSLTTNESTNEATLKKFESNTDLLGNIKSGKVEVKENETTNAKEVFVNGVKDDNLAVEADDIAEAIQAQKELDQLAQFKKLEEAEGGLAKFENLEEAEKNLELVPGYKELQEADKELADFKKLYDSEGKKIEQKKDND